MIEQGFNYAIFSIKEITDFFKTWVENQEPGEDKKEKSSDSSKKKKDKKGNKNMKEDYSD